MATYGDNGSSQRSVAELHTTSSEGGAHLNDYLLKSAHKLHAITELVSRGEAVDPDSHAWMLAQVDFIIETIGDESLKLSHEMRSDLLQLLLALANLNEHIRHEASLNR